MMDNATKLLLRARGYCGTDRDVRKAAPSDDEKAKEIALLRDMGLPFAAGKDWSSAEVFELFRERALISGTYLALSWLAPHHYQIEAR